MYAMYTAPGSPQVLELEGTYSTLTGYLSFISASWEQVVSLSEAERVLFWSCMMAVIIYAHADL